MTCGLGAEGVKFTQDRTSSTSALSPSGGAIGNSGATELQSDGLHRSAGQHDPASRPPAPSSANYAYVTLVTCGDNYVQGALTLVHSLAAAGSTAAGVVMVPNVSAAGRVALATFCVIFPVGVSAMDVAQRYLPRFSSDSLYVQLGTLSLSE
eukprot:jgi/Tetstr1/436778/TSEL_025558.t1